MNTLALNKLVSDQLNLVICKIPIYTATATGEREAPYILIESEALSERIIGKGTWECELRLMLLANAHDWTQLDFDDRFSHICERAHARLTADVLNEHADRMHIYSAKLQSIAPIEATEDDLSQSLVFRLLIQT